MTWSGAWSSPSRARSRRTRSSGLSLHLTKEEGGRHTHVLQGLPAAVLLPYDGRDGSGGVAGGHGDGDARDNVALRLKLNYSGGDGQGLRFAIRKAGTRWEPGTISELSSKTGFRRARHVLLRTCEWLLAAGLNSDSSRWSKRTRQWRAETEGNWVRCSWVG